MVKKRYTKLERYGTQWGFWDLDIVGLFITRPTKKAARKERKRRQKMNQKR